MSKTVQRRAKKSRRERMIALVACILALLLLLPMVVMVISNISSAGAAPSVSAIQSQIAGLKNKNKDISQQKSELKQQLSGIQAEKGKAVDKKHNLERQIDLIQDEIDNLNAQLEQYATLIAEKEAEVAENEARERAQFELFRKQCRAMEKEGTMSYWSILFSAKSFPDLLDKVHTVNSIADYNDRICDQLQLARAALKQAKAELEEAEAETEGAKAAREAAQNELAAQRAEVQSLINEIAADEKQTQAALDELNAAAKAMDAEIAKKEKELQAAIAAAQKSSSSGGSNPYQFDPGSGWYWPLPMNCVKVNSFYGPRKDPITGKSANHSGTDIGGAPTGTSIYAAHGGVVLTSAHHSSYGNYVVLSRGDGITTLYAHMSRRAVKVGDVVSQGQVIGYVGSTGRSTGPHLHFEVRVNGVRQDALKYYPNVQWINNTGFPYK